MKSIPEAVIESAFVTMMNKLIYGRSKILIPYAEMLKEKRHGEALDRIHEIEEALDGIYERKARAAEFFTKGLLDPAVFEQERDSLAAEESRLEAARKSLAGQVSGGNKQGAALEELLKFTSHREMLEAFDEQLFLQHVDHIIVYKRNEIGFSMKCGPTFREVLP